MTEPFQPWDWSAGDSLVRAALPLQRVAGFDEALRGHCAGLLDFYRTWPLATQILGDIGRLGIVAALLSGESLGRAEIARQAAGLASRRRVQDHLGALEHLGMVTSAVRGRRILVSATPGLRAMMQAWVEAYAGAVKVIFPDLAPASAAPDAAPAFLRQILGGHRRGFDALFATPRLARLMTLKGGYLLFLELLLANLEGVAFSRKAFAARLGISRTHVIDLLSECVALELVVVEDTAIRDGGLLAEGRRWFAVNAYLTRLTLRRRFLEHLDARRFDPVGIG